MGSKKKRAEEEVDGDDDSSSDEKEEKDEEDEDDEEPKPANKKKRTRNPWTEVEMKSMWALIKEHNGDLDKVIRLAKFNHPHASIRKKGLALLKRYTKELEENKQVEKEKEKKEEIPENEDAKVFSERLQAITAVNVTPQSKDDFSEDYSQTFKPVILVDDTRLHVIFPEFGQRVFIMFLFTESYVGVNMQISSLPSDQQFIQLLGFPESKQLVFPPVYLKYSFGKLRINPAKETIVVTRKDNLLVASAPIIHQNSLIVNAPIWQPTMDSKLQESPHTKSRESIQTKTLTNSCDTNSSSTDSPITATIHANQ